MGRSRRTDYANAGYEMISKNDPVGDKTARKGLAWAISMFALPFVCCWAGYSQHHFMLAGTIVNSYLMYYYWKFFKLRTPASARKAMVAGFWQLICLFAFLFIYIKDREKVQAFSKITDFLNHAARYGFNLCFFANEKETDEARRAAIDACPVHFFKPSAPEKSLSRKDD